jgi:hypothetical protein
MIRKKQQIILNQMSIAVLLIGIVLISLFILPFVLVGVGKNKEQKMLNRLLLKLAEDNNCKIAQSEFWTDSVIGLDETGKNLFFVHRVNSQDNSEHIKLTDVKSCSIRNHSRNVKMMEGNHMAIDKLELVFIKKEKNSPEVVLEFFNADGSKLYSDEVMLIEKWNKEVNSKLSKD